MSDDGAGEQTADAGPTHAVLPVVRRSGPQLPEVVEGPVDLALGAAVVLARPVVAVGVVAARAASPFARGLWALAIRPPLVPEAWSPAGVAARLSEQGRRVRFAAGEDLTAIGGQGLDVAVPAVLEPVLDRVDITALVLARVDLEPLVGAVLDTMDLTQVVLDRVDLERLVTAVLDTMDLTQVVLDRVDLQRVVETAIATLDLNDIVRTQVDLAAIANEVIDDVDLPEIIRESSTGVAAEVVDGARMSAVSADELVSRWVDRVLLRRQGRRTSVPAASTAPEDGNG